MPRVLLAAYGLSGSGKGTFVDMVRSYCAGHGLSVARLRLAEPLYQLQQEFRARAGIDLLPQVQDQVLMEAVATQLRRLNPRALVDQLLAELDATAADVVLNDDLRDPHTDYPAMRERGFRFVRIRCAEPTRQQRLLRRGDVSRSDVSTSGIDAIRADVVFDNDAGLDAFRHEVDRFMEYIVAAHRA
jgi:dephospho-CoA kinase